MTSSASSRFAVEDEAINPRACPPLLHKQVQPASIGMVTGLRVFDRLGAEDVLQLTWHRPRPVRKTAPRWKGVFMGTASANIGKITSKKPNYAPSARM